MVAGAVGLPLKFVRVSLRPWLLAGPDPGELESPTFEHRSDRAIEVVKVDANAVQTMPSIRKRVTN